MAGLLLIYPLPEGGGLGVHITADISGARRAGPDAEFVDTIDYTDTASATVTVNPGGECELMVGPLPCAGGIGTATAARFLEEGARVFVLDRDAAALERLAARLPVRPHRGRPRRGP